MIDHAPLFIEIVHPYLLKLYIAIYRNCTLLFTNYCTLLFTDYKGTQVRVDGVHLGYSVIRVKGNSQKLWIATERVSSN